ncbi:MAG TPA: hypothetical protein VHM48_05790 [Candidatus Limnocylindrales bacterium]|nr:hypothetical protein [Candidatus Limnocylindrales bacterium]
MKRLLGAVLAGFVALTWAVPVLAAGEVLAHAGRVLVAVGGDLVVPAGEQVRGVSTSTLFRPTTAPMAR